jgi:hypothetical protein
MKKFALCFVFLSVIYMSAGIANVSGQSDPKAGFTIGITTNGWEPFIGFVVVTEKIDYSLTISTSFSSDLWLRCYLAVIPHITSFDSKTIGIPISLGYAINRGEDNMMWFGLKSGVSVYDSISEKVTLFYGVEDILVSFRTDSGNLGFSNWGSVDAGTRLLF